EEGTHITPGSLPIAISRGSREVEERLDAARVPEEGLSLAENERRLLIAALQKANGNQTQAARLLRITRDTLRYKMKKYNLRGWADGRHKERQL
ncbi:MAG: helix-turn-helix domain-containing protein, partial [Candidatus Methanomethyliaceae archaeon]